MKLNVLALAVMLAYLSAVAVIAYFGARRVKSAADFIAAGGQLGFWTYCLLMIGSVFSGMTLIGVAGLAFTTGWSNVWERILGPAFAISFGTILIGYRLRTRYENLLTIQDFLAERYNDPSIIRMLAAIISAVTCFVYLIGQYTAIGVVSEIVLGIPYWMGATLAAVIVVTYVMSGGMFSTAWTTILQSLLMLSGIYITVPIIVSWIGGFETLNQLLFQVPQLQNATHGVDSGYLFAYHLTKPFAPAAVPLAGWAYNATLFGITVPLGLMVAPHVVNNMLTFRDIRYTRWSPLIMFILGFSAIMLVSLAGMAARVAWASGLLEIPDLNMGGMTVKWSDMAYPAVASRALPEWLFVILLPTILAGVMSTTDRLMVTAASNVSYDIIKNGLGIKLDERSLKLLSSAVVAAVGFGSLLLALSPPPLLAWFVWAALSLMVNCFFFPLILGLYWDGMTKNAARCSMLLGFVVTLATFATFGKTVYIFNIPIYASIPGFIASMLSAVFVSAVERAKG